MLLIFVGLSVTCVVNADQNASEITRAQVQKAISQTSDISILYNGKIVKLKSKPFVIDGYAYVPLKDVAKSVGATVNWDADEATVKMSSNDKQIEFKLNDTVAVVNGRRQSMPRPVVHRNTTYVQLRYLANLLELPFEWEGEVRAIQINTSGQKLNPAAVKSIVSASRPYTAEDILWLARIVYAEANTENYFSKLAVANVILNRAKCGSYPDTIKEVIFDTENGIQFTPAVNGAIYNKPNDECFEVADAALRGNNNAEDVLFFLNPRRATSSWIIENRKFAFRLQNHDFYY